MPGERSYLALSRDQINRVAKEAWTDASTLADLADELDHRRGPESDSLHFKLRQRIAEIEKSAGGLSPSRSPEPASPRLDSKPALLDRIRRLEAEVDRAGERALGLESDLAAARQRIRSLERQPGGLPSGRALYPRVGLDERCPDFVLAAARTAFRKRFHPDGHAGAAKGDAEVRFKEAEAVFDQILRLRARDDGPPERRRA